MIAERLKEERLRLGLTQEVLAESASIKRRTLQDWERGLSSPPAVQLAALSAAGMDVQYVLTGRRQSSGIGESAVYQAVLDAIDLLSLDNKIDPAQLAKAVVKLVAKAAQAAPADQAGVHNANSGPGVQQNFMHSSVGNVAAGDLIIGQGNKKG